MHQGHGISRQRKTVYGLNDVSRSWYLKAWDEIKKKGAVKSTFDNALFFWHSRKKLEGLICFHVDDFFSAGSQQFHNTVIDHLRAQFQLSKESLNQMLYTGIEYSQAHDKKIIIHQTEYTAKMEPLHLTNMSKDRALDALEVRQFKSLVGQLQWTAKQLAQTLPLLPVKLSTKVKDATTTDVRCANKQVRKLQTESGAVCIPNTSDVRQSALNLYVYSDASFADLAGDAVLKVAMLFSSKEKMVKLHRSYGLLTN